MSVSTKPELDYATVVRQLNCGNDLKRHPSRMIRSGGEHVCVFCGMTQARWEEYQANTMMWNMALAVGKVP